MSTSRARRAYAGGKRPCRDSGRPGVTSPDAVTPLTAVPVNALSQYRSPGVSVSAQQRRRSQVAHRPASRREPPVAVKVAWRRSVKTLPSCGKNGGARYSRARPVGPGHRRRTRPPPGGGEGVVAPRGSRSPTPPWGSRCDDQRRYHPMQRILSHQLPAHVDETVTLAGWVHRRRLLKSVAFLIVRYALPGRSSARSARSSRKRAYAGRPPSMCVRRPASRPGCCDAGHRRVENWRHTRGRRVSSRRSRSRAACGPLRSSARAARYAAAASSARPRR